MENFLNVYQQFKLGELTTESFHPDTRNLSEIANEDLTEAIKILQLVDSKALVKLKNELSQCYRLHIDIKNTLERGDQIFLCGCGATGRLSLALESFWRALYPGNHQVIGFMAGGDYALIKSVESFEDNASYGQRQLLDLGYKGGDLLLGITEGGETSFVLGAINAAISNSKPWFIYCNPDEELKSIERSNNLLKNENVEKLNLSTGAMAISGSTRMQASTVQMLAVYFALFYPKLCEKDFISQAEKEIDELLSLDAQFIKSFIEAESKTYIEQNYVTYVSDSSCAITILTDTTERSPTFSLAAFEKLGQPHKSLAYLTLEETKTPSEAWEKLLKRSPRTLEWRDLPIGVGKEELYKFDISEKSVTRRNAPVFKIQCHKDTIEFIFLNQKFKLRNISKSFVVNQIGLKLVLNIHSTLLMARLGRVEGNVMSFVRPSNYKLIDRATRYVLELAAREQIKLSYIEVAKEVIKQSSSIEEGQSVVIKSLEALKN